MIALAQLSKRTAKLKCSIIFVIEWSWVHSNTTETGSFTVLEHKANTFVRVQIDSSLQGHLKALTKLTRGIERAIHHSQLLQTAIETKRPPRGLIPKVSPKIPDTPGSFTIEWENSLQEAGLVLTKKLQDYWSSRATRLQAEYSPIYNNLKSISTQEQWNTMEDILQQTSRDLQQELKRKRPRQPNPQPSTSLNNPTKRNIIIAGSRNQSPQSQI